MLLRSPPPSKASLPGFMDLNRVYIGLGGNIGDTYAIIASALAQTQALEGVHELRSSSLYRTAPVSPWPQRYFVNGAATFLTSLSPYQLLAELKKVELSLGKVPKPKDAPRTIDLDILFFGDIFLDTAELQLPHPRWHERLFVLEPLAELTELVPVPAHDGLKWVNVHAAIAACRAQAQHSWT